MVEELGYGALLIERGQRDEHVLEFAAVDVHYGHAPPHARLLRNGGTGVGRIAEEGRVHLDGWPKDDDVTPAVSGTFDEVYRGLADLVDRLTRPGEQHIAVPKLPIALNAVWTDTGSGASDKELVLRVQIPVSDARYPVVDLIFLRSPTALEERAHTPEPLNLPVLGNLSEPLHTGVAVVGVWASHEVTSASRPMIWLSSSCRSASISSSGRGGS